MALPRFVNAVATFTYDTAAIKGSLVAMNPGMEITDEDVMSMIEDWAYEDSRGLDYVLQDEDGNVL